MDKMKKNLGLLDLVLLNIVAIVGLRWTSIAAGIGIFSVFLWLCAFLLFFIPSAFVVTELSRRYPHEGGIYVWTREAYGEFDGFLCGFCYWVNNLIYYPNLLIFQAGIFLYVGGAQWLTLENNTYYSVVFSLVVLWIVILANMINLNAGKWVQNTGGLATWLPAMMLILAGVWVYTRSGSATPLNRLILPGVGVTDMFGVFASLCFGYAGLELSACMAGEIKAPERNIPRAIVISGVMILLIYVLVTVSMMVILPSDSINMVTGVLQAIGSFGGKIGVYWPVSLFAVLMTLGGLGGCGAWLSGTARIPFVIGIDRYFPSWMGKIHPRWGTPANAVLTQGLVCTFFILLTLGSKSVKESYLLLLDATLVLYFIPYLYMFLSFIALKRKQKAGEKGYSVIFGYVGLFVTAFAILMTLAPPADVANVGVYELKVIGGSLGFVILGLLSFRWGSRRRT